MQNCCIICTQANDRQEMECRLTTTSIEEAARRYRSKLSYVVPFSMHKCSMRCAMAGCLIGRKHQKGSPPDKEEERETGGCMASAPKLHLQDNRRPASNMHHQWTLNFVLKKESTATQEATRQRGRERCELTRRNKQKKPVRKKGTSEAKKKIRKDMRMTP